MKGYAPVASWLNQTGSLSPTGCGDKPLTPSATTTLAFFQISGHTKLFLAPTFEHAVLCAWDTPAGKNSIHLQVSV